MNVLRKFLARHRSVAVMLIVAALCMKAIVPAGYMINRAETVLTVAICSDTQGGQSARQIILPGDSSSHGSKNEHGKWDGTCAFSALSFASLGSADPLLLEIALAFILALAFMPASAPQPAQQSHLRPPLRGPPALV